MVTSGWAWTRGDSNGMDGTNVKTDEQHAHGHGHNLLDEGEAEEDLKGLDFSRGPSVACLSVKELGSGPHPETHPRLEGLVARKRPAAARTPCPSETRGGNRVGGALGGGEGAPLHGGGSLEDAKTAN